MKKYSGCTILLFVLLLMSCDNILDKTDMDTSEMVSKATESRYSEMEIREYNGIKLDPSVGPRDNSIRGIQNVDIENGTSELTY